VLAAENIEFRPLNARLRKVTESITRLAQALPRAQELVHDGYVLFTKWAEFKSEVDPLLAKSSAALDEIRAKYEELAQKFGDDPKRGDPVQWLGHIGAFLRGIRLAADENERKAFAKADAEKKAQAAAGRTARRPQIDAFVPRDIQRGVLECLDARFAQRSMNA
jgi:hypothetical protein